MYVIHRVLEPFPSMFLILGIPINPFCRYGILKQMKIPITPFPYEI